MKLIESGKSQYSGILGASCHIEVGQTPLEAFTIYGLANKHDKRPFTNIRLLEE